MFFLTWLILFLFYFDHFLLSIFLNILLQVVEFYSFYIIIYWYLRAFIDLEENVSFWLLSFIAVHNYSMVSFYLFVLFFYEPLFSQKIKLNLKQKQQCPTRFIQNQNTGKSKIRKSKRQIMILKCQTLQWIIFLFFG